MRGDATLKDKDDSEDKDAFPITLRRRGEDETDKTVRMVVPAMPPEGPRTGEGSADGEEGEEERSEARNELRDEKGRQG